MLSGASADIVVNAMVGISGLVPTLVSLEAGSKVALANKETLVTAGEILKRETFDILGRIIPIDSEHFSLLRLLSGVSSEIEDIILTASGGPFYKKQPASLKNVSIEDVLSHPTWNMGNKITIDSATMMNKGLEIIEAVHLFDVSHEKIEVLIHPQSIVHSMVGYKDGCIMAQLG